MWTRHVLRDSKIVCSCTSRLLSLCTWRQKADWFEGNSTSSEMLYRWEEGSLIGKKNKVIRLPKIPDWYTWEEGLLCTHLRQQTLEQTYQTFFLLLFIVGSVKRDLFEAYDQSSVFFCWTLENLYFWWILFELVKPWPARSTRIKSRGCCKILIWIKYKWQFDTANTFLHLKLVALTLEWP